MRIGIGLGLQAMGVGGGGAPPAPSLFAFELLTEAGSPTITAVPNLRVSLNGGTTWQSLPAAGLTIARHGDGNKLVVSGWSSNAVRDAAQFHYEQSTPGEPNQTTLAFNALWVRKVGDTAPINTAMPAGLQVCATVHDAPVGVT